MVMNDIDMFNLLNNSWTPSALQVIISPKNHVIGFISRTLGADNPVGKTMFLTAGVEFPLSSTLETRHWLK